MKHKKKPVNKCQCDKIQNSLLVLKNEDRASVNSINHWYYECDLETARKIQQNNDQCIKLL